MTCGIYKITDVRNGKIYIGKSVNIEKRWKAHINSLKSGNHRNNYLQHSYNKYGIDIFLHDILEICNKEFLDEREIFYIENLNTLIPNGYNLTSGGDSPLSVSEETREKIRLSKLGNKNPMYGKTPSLETIEKMRESMLGKNKGKTHTEETKKILRSYKGEKASMYGKTHSKETREKLSKNIMGKKNYAYGKKRKNASSKYYGVCFDKYNNN